jgi:hypothetical protein
LNDYRLSHNEAAIIRFEFDERHPFRAQFLIIKLARARAEVTTGKTRGPKLKQRVSCGRRRPSRLVVSQ